MTIRAIGGLPGGLAAILSGGDPEQESHPQAAAGTQFAQAMRLRELYKALSENPSAPFSPGDMVRLRPEFREVNPHRYPHKDYPAVVLSTDPEADGYRIRPHSADSIIHVNNMIIGVLMAQPSSGDQHLLFYTADARFFEKIPEEEITIEVTTAKDGS